MKIYLDNCCYNRPFDDQSQLRVQLETTAKLQIQREIRQGKYELVWSYVLDYENAKNPFDDKKNAIAPWKNLAVQNVMETEEILKFAEKKKKKGIKTYDALHISCAVAAGCEYYLTTDRKLLKRPLDRIKVLDPIQFIIEQEEV